MRFIICLARFASILCHPSTWRGQNAQFRNMNLWLIEEGHLKHKMRLFILKLNHWSRGFRIGFIEQSPTRMNYGMLATERPIQRFATAPTENCWPSKSANYWSNDFLRSCSYVTHFERSAFVHRPVYTILIFYARQCRRRRRQRWAERPWHVILLW